ncbi:glycosyltransferase [Falsirhodobacter sp. 20TX0035]|uniref:glycosyltransferase n=1 Tax=Falsirhodobacter sp. 20TX0035 TaxID=3022019 RepID=UPI00232DA9C9|nr:glycosyltransferase [Falsirhodobacter sp. 20TX0035]MDB6452834.1 glycosyltransferase [Falsirhodobacter sp. 20TX0035]
MIFATVGTQLPFPRLIDALAALAPDLGEPVVAQAGPGEAARPGLDLRESLTPDAFSDLFRAARVVVAHAGIGTVLSARRFGKPLVVLPRRHGLGEHRNDHQSATARQLQGLPGIYVAWEVPDLAALLRQGDLEPARDGRSPSHQALLARLRDFVG